MKPGKTDLLDGFFLGEVLKDGGDSGDDDNLSDEEDFVDFSDNNIFSPSATHLESNPLKYRKARFREWRSGKEHHVEGLLHFCEPWWSAQLRVRKARGFGLRVVGYPAYKLRTDPGVVRDKLVQLLLHQSKVEDQHTQLFMDYLRLNRLEGELNFATLPDLLERFGETSAENEEVKLSILKFLKAGPGVYVLGNQGMDYFFQLMPQLLPKQFKKILENESQMIPCLQKTLQDDPWTFGFSKILSQKHQLFGCEAPLQNFYNCGIIEKFPEPIRDALHIYDVLKSLCRRLGHTHTVQRWLPKSHYFKDYHVKHWAEALDFLEAAHIIVIEDKESKDGAKIYLTPLWNAENGIATGIKTLFDRHKVEPWNFEMDFTNPRFKDLMGDTDQMNAALLISQKPIVALSGKGGCGKTTVVSAVFQYAQELLNKIEMPNYGDDHMFPDDELDDLLLTQTADNFEKGLLQNPDSVTNGTDDEIDDLLLTQTADNFEKELLLNPNSIKSSTTSTNCTSQSLIEPCTSETAEEIEQNGFMDKQKKDDKDGQDDDNPTILLTAPTGKAANHLGKKSKLPSFTLHQVIFSYWHWKRGGSSVKGKFVPASDEWKFADVQALVVDECSLVSVSTFNTMFSALLEDANLKKVVLLGDVHQLPSIEPGYFLGDLFESLQSVGCTAMLTHNHRSESELIIHNASRIAQQIPPVVDPKRNFHQISLEELGRGMNPDSSSDDLGMAQDAAIRGLLKSNNPMIDNPKKSQFVAFRRSDCEAINEICSLHYGNHPTIGANRKMRVEVNDKVCCGKNGMVKNELNGEDLRLCNGEILFVKGDREEVDNRSRAQRFLLLEYDDGTVIEVNFRMLKNICKLKHAWARTIHTYQGSESDAVVYVVGSPGGQTWQHVYTAVTRGKKQVVMVTRPSHLDTAIRTEPLRRRTSLRVKVTEQLAEVIKVHKESTIKLNTPRKGFKHGSSSQGTPSKANVMPSQKTALIAEASSSANSQTNCNNTKPTGNHSTLKTFEPKPSTSKLSSIQQPSRPSTSKQTPIPCNAIDDGSRPGTSSMYMYGDDIVDPVSPVQVLEELDSQTFSDWGDDFVANVTQLESESTAQRKKSLISPFAISSSTAEEKVNVLRHADLNLPQKFVEPQGSPHSVDELNPSKGLSDELFNDLVKSNERSRAPPRRKVNIPTPQKDHRRRLFENVEHEDFDDFLDDIDPTSLSFMRNDHENAMQAQFKKTKKVSLPASNVENEEKEDFDDLMDDLLSTSNISKKPPERTSKNQAVVQSGTQTKTNGQGNLEVQQGSSSTNMLSSPKRNFTGVDYSDRPIKRRQEFLPVTNSDVSPLRRELLDISLSQPGTDKSTNK